MKSKYFLIKVSGIVGLIVIILLYFLLYFIPSLKSISRYKRELKDMNLKITDFVRQENAFTYSNDEERRHFEETEKELLSRIPEVKTREDYILLFTRVSDHIQKLAREDGILNLVLKSDSAELSVNASTFSRDKKTLDDLVSFTARRLLELRKEQEQAEERRRGTGTDGVVSPPPGMNSDLYALVKGIKFHSVILSFTGELKNAMNFINHIPWSDYYLGEDKVLIAAGDFFPYYILLLKIYYIDKRS